MSDNFPPDKKWTAAEHRARVLADLPEQLAQLDVERATRQLDVSRATLFRWLKKFREDGRTSALPLRRESQIDERMLTRIPSVTGGITAGIFSVMSQLAIAAIESGEERIMPGDVSSTGKLQAVLGEPV